MVIVHEGFDMDKFYWVIISAIGQCLGALSIGKKIISLNVRQAGGVGQSFLSQGDMGIWKWKGLTAPVR